jgi:hypothetical protein
MNRATDGHTPEPGGASWTSVRARQFWLPRSSRLAISGSAAIIDRHESFAHNILDLPIKLASIARAENILHWTPLPFDFLAETQTAEIAAATHQTARSQPNADRSPAEPGRAPFQQEHAQPNTSRWLAEPGRAPLQQERGEFVLARPAGIRKRPAERHAAPKIEASGFRPIIQAKFNRPRTRAGSPAPATTVSPTWRPLAPALSEVRSTLENSSVADATISHRQFQQRPTQLQQPISSEAFAADVFAPQLMLSISQSPRREVPGGFPSRRHAPIETYAARSPAQIQTTGESALIKPAARPLTVSDRAMSRTIQALTESHPEPRSAMEKLIERSIVPSRLPGLEFRLIEPTGQASDFHSEANEDSARQPPVNDQYHTQPIASAPTPAPPVNINEVADKVYQTLMRRQQLERERKGLY